MLELSLKLQLCERVDVFSYVNMIAVCDIPLVCNAFDNTETSLQALRKLICRGFKRSSVKREVDVVHFLPLTAGGVHFFHYIERERCGGWVCVALSGHVLDTLVKSGVSEGNCGISAAEEIIYGFAFFQSRASSVLPEDGRGVGQSSLKSVVAAHERTVAQLQSFVEYLPELLNVSAGRQRDIGEV